MLEHPLESKCAAGTTPAETATDDKRNTSDRTVNKPPVKTSLVNTLPVNTPSPCIYSSTVSHIQTADTSPSSTSHCSHPSTLYDLLIPKLIHQHSLHTTVQQLLLPITHLTTLPVETITKLHTVLRGNPHLLTHLPPLPTARLRPLRTPLISYEDLDQPQMRPPPSISNLPIWNPGWRWRRAIYTHHIG